MAKKRRILCYPLDVPAKTCVVSFEHDGIRHSAEISAESLYEAAILGWHAIREKWGEGPYLCDPIHVEVREPVVVHQITRLQVRQWLKRSGKSPKEMTLKHKLEQLIDDNGF